MAKAKTKAIRFTHFSGGYVNEYQELGKKKAETVIKEIKKRDLILLQPQFFEVELDDDGSEISGTAKLIKT